MGVAHRDDEHLVVAVARPAAGARHLAGQRAAFLREPLEGRAEQRLEVDLVEAELAPGEVGVHVAAGLGVVAEGGERDLHLLARVRPDHPHGVVHHVGVDALEDAALGVRLAHADLVERVVVLEALRVDRDGDAEERLRVAAHRGARERHRGGVGELLDGLRPRPVVGQVVDLVEHEERLVSLAVLDERLVATLPGGVLVGSDHDLSVEVLEEDPVRVGRAEGHGLGAEPVEDLRQFVGVGVLVAEVAAGDEHDEPVGDAQRPRDDVARQRRDGLAVAGYEHAERVPLGPAQQLRPALQEDPLALPQREPVPQADAGQGDAGGGVRGERSGGRGHGRSAGGQQT